MSKFKFEVPAPLNSASAYSKIKNLLSGENDFKKFDPKVSCTFDESNKAVKIDGSQFKAELTVNDKGQDSCGVAIEVEVPLALSFFKGKIQSTIENNIKKILT